MSVNILRKQSRYLDQVLLMMDGGISAEPNGYGCLGLRPRHTDVRRGLKQPTFATDMCRLNQCCASV